jgi:hypothetical protein
VDGQYTTISHVSVYLARSRLAALATSTEGFVDSAIVITLLSLVTAIYSAIGLIAYGSERQEKSSNAIHP